MASGKHQAPKGTRDLYPEDTARVRYIQKAWTDTALRHGFEEIEGPTFETSELYAVKSGEGILGELFQAFSGKDPAEIEEVQRTGRAPFALRPEFTPTLARMYAARAKQLNKPAKWFTAGAYFRAERPQRGRLREFLQWNVDVIGDDGTPEGRAQADAEVAFVGTSLFESLGLQSTSIRLRFFHRDVWEQILVHAGARREKIPDWLVWIDQYTKRSSDQRIEAACAFGENEDLAIKIGRLIETEDLVSAAGTGSGELPEGVQQEVDADVERAEYELQKAMHEMHQVVLRTKDLGLSTWCELDASIVRGLAYYTGTVFEAIAEGERAVAGGGRYDNLIELMGGPPTPAVGFAMGDVVLGLLLEDKGLMPEGGELLDAVSAPGASRRPEVFVLGADDEASDPMVRRLVADLRRGVESERHKQDSAKPWSPARYETATGGVRPMHARQSYKSTRNLKKLLADAERQLARFAAVVHGADRVQLRDLDRRAELTPKDAPGLPDSEAEFSVDPASPVYVGRAVQALLA